MRNVRSVKKSDRSRRAGKKNRSGRDSEPRFRLNPVRQAAFVCLALAGIAIGYGVGYLLKGESPPPKQEATEAPATKPAPTVPETGAGISNRSRPPAPARQRPRPCCRKRESSSRQGPSAPMKKPCPGTLSTTPPARR